MAYFGKVLKECKGNQWGWVITETGQKFKFCWEDTIGEVKYADEVRFYIRPIPKVVNYNRYLRRAYRIKTIRRYGEPVD